MSDIQSALSEIQQKLNAPKNQFNKFGKYAYRSCEDIFEGLKPVLGSCSVTLSDDVVMVGDRIYIKAVATFHLGTESISVSGFAREEESQKGMAGAQLTGSTSSYARKYALNGLFLIDDNKDADSNESKNQANNAPKQAVKPVDPAINEAINTNNASWVKAQYNPGVIADNWQRLSTEQIDKIHILLNQQ